MHRRSNKAKQRAAPLSLKNGRHDVPSLFCCNPEENYDLWLQKCFPDGAIAREDAIRQWLMRPVDIRFQNGRNHNAESAKSSASQAPTDESEQHKNDRGPSNTGNPNLTAGSGWNSTLFAPKEKNRFFNRFAITGTSLSKILLKLVRCSAIAILIVMVVGVTPVSKGTTRASGSINAKESSNIVSARAGIAPQEQKPTGIASKLPVQPESIESLWIGCEDARPCVGIQTRGNASVPVLSALTNPDRLIMDFPNAVRSPNIRGIEGHGAVKSVRIGQHIDRTTYTRLVIDLTKQCGYRLRVLTNGVVLQIYPQTTRRQAGSRDYSDDIQKPAGRNF